MRLNKTEFLPVGRVFELSIHRTRDESRSKFRPGNAVNGTGCFQQIGRRQWHSPDSTPSKSAASGNKSFYSGVSGRVKVLDGLRICRETLSAQSFGQDFSPRALGYIFLVPNESLSLKKHSGASVETTININNARCGIPKFFMPFTLYEGCSLLFIIY